MSDLGLLVGRGRVARAAIIEIKKHGLEGTIIRIGGQTSEAQGEIPGVPIIQGPENPLDAWSIHEILKKYQIARVAFAGNIGADGEQLDFLRFGATVQSIYLVPYIQQLRNALLAGNCRPNQHRIKPYHAALEDFLTNQHYTTIFLPDLFPDAFQAPRDFHGMLSTVPFDVAGYVSKAELALSAQREPKIIQSVILDDGEICQVEEEDGTDGLLERFGDSNAKKQFPVLVKLPVPGSKWRIAAPTIGDMTVVKCRDAGVRGIIIVATKTLVVNPKLVLKLCGDYGVFLWGL